MQLPESFLSFYSEKLGDEAPAFFQSLDAEKARGLRFNSISQQAQQNVIDLFQLKALTNPTGFTFNESARPGRHPFHHAGLYYIQDPSAQLVAYCANIQANDTVLDLCAAPGGKSTHIATLLDHTGLLVSNEIDPQRAKILSENIERMGLRNVLVTNESASRLKLIFQEYFDKIILDAPCSGEGMFRKDEIARKRWSRSEVLRLSSLQKELISEALSMLKPGGELTYSTCTFSPEENEQVIAYALENFDVSLLDLPPVIGALPGIPEWADGNLELKKGYRLFPHHFYGEGHFIVRIKKNSSLHTPPQLKGHRLPHASKKQLDIFNQFQQQYLLAPFTGNIVAFGAHLSLIPDIPLPPLNTIKIIRLGLSLGEVKKERFEPSHSLALYLSPNNVKNTVSLSFDDAVRYLAGISLPYTTEINGWALICIEQFPLGWGKLNNQMLKNNYPKGLRIKGI